MPKYVCIAAHISIGELENRYRKATDPVERSHFQIIWLLAQGKRVREVSEVTGYCANWIRILARRYNQKGPLAVTDQRQHNRGAIPLLSKDQQEQLQHILEETASDGGLWTGRKVALWMGKQTRRKIHTQRGWDYLKRLDFSLLIPRPRHHKSNKEQQEAFKQALPEEVQHLQQIYPQAKIGLWCMDEHRIGLKPVVRRIWARHPGIAQSFACNTGMNGSMYTDLPIPNQERAIGCYCPRSVSRFSPLLWSILHRLLVPAQIGASSWCWIVPGGIAVRCS